jgi:aspartate-semialdehyde dehydrogenase
MMTGNRIDVAIVGATGLVGRTMARVLEERAFPIRHLHLMASSRSVGKRLTFCGERIRVRELTARSLASAGAHIALFSAGAAVSREFAPVAARAGTLVIDNSSAFRMHPDVPLVVPEVNPGAIGLHRGIIANPNCSTIQLVVALKPLHDRFTIRRIVVSTYQAVTGAGQRGYDQLMSELAGRKPVRAKFPHPIAFNVLPQIDEFSEDGYTKEEHKMMAETRKILGDDSIRLTATCVRVPVVGGHSEAATVEFARPFALEEVRSALRQAPGVALVDDPDARTYPMPLTSQGRDEVFVGRLRRDPSAENSLNLWIVSDNIRKGAATNAVQIAEAWMKVRDSI